LATAAAAAADVDVDSLTAATQQIDVNSQIANDRARHVQDELDELDSFYHGPEGALHPAPADFDDDHDHWGGNEEAEEIEQIVGGDEEGVTTEEDEFVEEEEPKEERSMGYKRKIEDVEQRRKKVRREEEEKDSAVLGAVSGSASPTSRSRVESMTTRNASLLCTGPVPDMHTMGGCDVRYLNEANFDVAAAFESRPRLGSSGKCLLKFGFHGKDPGPSIILVDDAGVPVTGLSFSYTTVRSIHTFTRGPAPTPGPASSKGKSTNCVWLSVAKPPYLSTATRVQVPLGTTNPDGTQKLKYKTGYTSTKTDPTPGKMATARSVFIITSLTDYHFKKLNRELAQVEALRGKFFESTPPTSGPHVFEMNEMAGRIGRQRGIPLIESHPSLVLELANKCMKHLAVARQKLTLRRVQPWVAELEGEQFFENFVELRDFLEAVATDQDDIERRVASTEAKVSVKSTTSRAA
jgi:hypothetical protein